MTMHTESNTRRVKLFMNGRSQAVRLPAEFRFAGDEVLMRKDELTGDVVISAADRMSWSEFEQLRDTLLAEVPAQELDEYMRERDQPFDGPRDLYASEAE